MTLLMTSRLQDMGAVQILSLCYAKKNSMETRRMGGMICNYAPIGYILRGTSSLVTEASKRLVTEATWD